MRYFALILVLIAGCSSSSAPTPAPAASSPSKASPYVQQKASDLQGQEK